jgi:hypothetical protein
MTSATSERVEAARNSGLPRRDWILLPLLSLLAIGFLAGASEWASRRVFYRLPSSGESCLTIKDPLNGAQGIPNCVVWEKIPEGKPTQYRFNREGYRNDVEFAPKPPETFRIVLIGSSVAAGFRAPREQTIAGLLPELLSQRTGRRIEVYSTGLPWRSADAVSRDLKDAIALHPDVILWILSPLDITYTSALKNTPDETPVNIPTGAGQTMKSWYEAKAVFSNSSFGSAVGKLFSHTYSATMLRDFFYRSPSQYVQASLAGADYNKDFLRNQPSAAWQEELREFSRGVAGIEDQAAKANIPLVAVLVPDRTQAAMISMMNDRPSGFDPYKLGGELRSLVINGGGKYIDILPDFQTIKNPQLGYFAMDGHPNGVGYATITRFLAREMLAADIPGLSSGAPQPQSGPRP